MPSRLQRLAQLNAEFAFFDPVLAGVTTPEEAMFLWQKSPSAVRYAIESEWVEYRRVVTSGRGTILITTSSLVELWGNPVHDLRELQKEGSNVLRKKQVAKRAQRKSREYRKPDTARRTNRTRQPS